MTAVVVDLAKERRKRAERDRLIDQGRANHNAYVHRQEQAFLASLDPAQRAALTEALAERDKARAAWEALGDKTSGKAGRNAAETLQFWTGKVAFLTSGAG